MNPIRKIARSGSLPVSFESVEDYMDYLRDPRREFTEDSELWQRLLTQAAARSETVFHALHCLRCGGAKIGTEDGHYKFKPRYIDPDNDPERGTAWEDRDDWELDCKDLIEPQREVMRDLLLTLNESDESEPNVREGTP